MTAFDLVGYAGAVCNAISFIPQLARVYQLKSARDISFSTFLIFGIGSALWITYGFHFHSIPVVAANLITLAMSFSIFVLKVRYDRPQKQYDPFPLTQGVRRTK